MPRIVPAGTELSNHIETHVIGQEHYHELNHETILKSMKRRKISIICLIALKPLLPYFILAEFSKSLPKEHPYSTYYSNSYKGSLQNESGRLIHF